MFSMTELLGMPAYIFSALAGIGLIIAGILVKKKFRIAFFIVGGILAAAGIFLLISAGILAAYVRSH